MKSAHKVLHVYSGNLFGGVERMLISVAKLDTPGNSSRFALCFEGRLSHALRAEGAKVSLLGPVRLRNPLSALRARRALKRLLATDAFDAVVCHSIWSYCIFAPVVERAGLARIAFLHDIPSPNGAFYRWAWRRPPALCIVNSTTTAEPLERMPVKVPNRIVHPLVPPPAAPASQAVRQLRTQWGAAEEDVVILLASRFESLKGHRNLLQALAAMNHVANWRCWIAGAPQRPEEHAYKQELVMLTDALGLRERVSYIGHRDDMETTLAACDLYCQPNETPEAFGMVFIEALYAGKPVVGRALGGAREIITPDCGVLCDAGVESLASALEKLCSDRKLRERMALAGPARASALCAADVFSAALAAALDSVRSPAQ